MDQQAYITMDSGRHNLIDQKSLPRSGRSSCAYILLIILGLTLVAVKVSRWLNRGLSATYFIAYVPVM